MLRAQPLIALLCGLAGGGLARADEPLACDPPAGCSPLVDEPPLACAEGLEVPAPYGAKVGSLLVKRSTAVRSRPDARSPALGTIAQDMRTLWTGAATGYGCPRWVGIVPRGWVCEDALKPNFRPPKLLELPKLGDDGLVPGVYGKVVGKRTRAWRPGEKGWTWRFLRGANTVDRRAVRRIGKREFWRTSEREYIPASAIRLHAPSAFAGVELEIDPGSTLVFAVSKKRPNAPVEVREAPSPGARVVGTLDPRALLPSLGEDPSGAFVRVGDGQWVARADTRRVQQTEPPPGVGCNERWMDVDADEQVLVAYEGVRPAFATLVSTGKPGTPTPAGTFRVWMKHAEADMRGAKDGKRYSVARVPWTMFFLGDFALHCAYWHDAFGRAASHGCVNLSPLDARFLYAWTSPHVPEGWTAAYASPEDPGSLVRVRSRTPPPPSADDEWKVAPLGALARAQLPP